MQKKETRMKNDNIRTSVPVRHPGRVLLAVPWCQGPVGLHPVEPRAMRHRRSTLSPSEAILIAWHSGFFSSRFSGPTLSIGRRLQVQDGGTHRHASRRKGFSKGLFEIRYNFSANFFREPRFRSSLALTAWSSTLWPSCSPKRTAGSPFLSCAACPAG